MAEVGRESPVACAGRAVAVLALGLVAYRASFAGAFVYDDLVAIVGNPHFAPLWPPDASLWAVPGTGLAGRPVVSFSLALNHALGGFAPWGYHLLSLLGHLTAALLLMALVRRTLLTPRLAERYGSAAGRLALASAALWVVHPLGTGAVTYVYQRSEVAMAVALFATLLASMRAWDGPRAGLWRASAVAACWIGMGCKETMAAAPLLALAHDALFGAGSLRAAWARRRGTYLAMAASWLALAALLIHSGAHGPSVGFSGHVGVWDYLKTQAWALVHYLRLAVWPQPLVFDYGWPVPATFGAWAPQAAIVIGLLAATVVALRRGSPAGFLGLACFAVLAPTSSVLPIVTELVVEHRTYVPLAAVVVLLVCPAWRLGARGALGAALLVVAVALLCWRTDARNRQYANPAVLWTASLRRFPGNARAEYALGDLALAAGELGEARRRWRRAVELQPEESFWRLNPGVAAYEAGDYAEASELLGAAVRLKPDWPQAHYDLGLLQTRMGDPAAAIASFERALELAPGYLDALRGLGIACARAGREEEARRQLTAVLAARSRDVEAAVELAELLVASRDPGVRDGERAEHLVRRAERIAGDPDARILSALAAAQAERGAFDEALVTLERARALARPAELAELDRRRALFAAGRTVADG